MSSLLGSARSCLAFHVHTHAPLGKELSQSLVKQRQVKMPNESQAASCHEVSSGLPVLWMIAQHTKHYCCQATKYHRTNPSNTSMKKAASVDMNISSGHHPSSPLHSPSLPSGCLACSHTLCSAHPLPCHRPSFHMTAAPSPGRLSPQAWCRGSHPDRGCPGRDWIL